MSAGTAEWPTDVREAIAVQQALRERVRLEDDLGEVRTVGGIDVAFARREGERVARCAVVVLAFPEMRPLEQAAVEVPVTFPYVPGLLAFREGPAIETALARLSSLPNLLLFDGHGYAHPRRMGIACHLGVLLDRPAVGCAKSILFGQAEEPGTQPGDRTRFVAPDGELLGYALRTMYRSRPVFVSPGHRVSPDTAVDLVMQCVRGYRLPEPTRLADQLSKACRPATGRAGVGRTQKGWGEGIAQDDPACHEPVRRVRSGRLQPAEAGHYERAATRSAPGRPEVPGWGPTMPCAGCR